MILDQKQKINAHSQFTRFFSFYKISFYLLLSFFFLSCSETPNQYTPSLVSNREPIPPKPPFLVIEPSNPLGGLLFGSHADFFEDTEAQKDRSTRKNSLIPIDYKNSSVANINMETTYQESQNILNFNFKTPSGLDVYKEGVAIAWRNDAPRTPDVIVIFSSYLGTIDFGAWIGELRHRRVGSSFADQFSVGEEGQDILEDPKARNFIISLYQHLEDTTENCLETQTCSLSINPQGSYILFNFAKMTLLFGNNERKNLVQVAFTKDDDPACFNSPFDLLNNQFFCEKPDGSKTVFKLGDSYKSVIEKSSINPELPISYENNLLIQRTKSTILAWKRQNFEEKVKQIPESSHLSLVYMGSNQYSLPFLLNESLIKVSLESENKVQVSLDPLAEPGKTWELKDILKKVQAINANPSEFYLATEMPQIKENILAQNNLIKALLDLLEETYKKAHTSLGSELKVYKRLFGQHNDKFALESSGIFIASKSSETSNESKTEYPTQIWMKINYSSGQSQFQFSIIDDDFQNYIIKQQEEILNFQEGEIQKLAGFQLGDKIYLRDKRLGPDTAIIAYPVSNDKALITLADYSDEIESSAVYTSGRDNNIIFEKSELISIYGSNLYILPTLQTKTIGTQVFDEYEIHKISVTGFRFFGSIQGICKMENINFNMGMHDRNFSNTLIKTISEQTNQSQSEESCFYLAPNDPLFAGVKRSVFFPSHKLIFNFSDRELSAVTIYKKPPVIIEEQK